MKNVLLVLISAALLSFSQSSLPGETEEAEFMLSRLLSSAKFKVEVLPMDKPVNDSIRRLMQSKSFSPMEALLYNHGGILVDNGWLRILGAGSSQLERNIPEWNRGKSFTYFGEPPKYLLIAEDVIGGFYAINRGGLEDYDINKVFYYGPNSLQWVSMNMDFSQFLSFCFSDSFKDFYSDFRWKGWEEEVQQLSTGQVISCYPLLWTKEGKELKKNRNPITVQSLWNLYQKHNDLMAAKVNNASGKRTSK